MPALVCLFCFVSFRFVLTILDWPDHPANSIISCSRYTDPCKVISNLFSMPLSNFRFKTSDLNPRKANISFWFKLSISLPIFYFCRKTCFEYRYCFILFPMKFKLLICIKCISTVCVYIFLCIIMETL